MTVFKTEVYTKWIKKLRDDRARYRILTRIERLTDGNPGDSRFLGDISELRIDYGPGYRVYYKTIEDCQDTGKGIVILLCGGDKTTQEADIAHARRLAALPIQEKQEENKDGNADSK
jgi:putative addiction module killer protein